jgi:O-antigen/teichoic acid export membrane protein
MGKGLSLLSVVIIARILGKETYGAFGFIINTMISIAILSSFGLGYTSTKYIAENKKTNPGWLFSISKTCQLITLFVSFISSCILFFYADYFAHNVFEQPRLVTAIKFTSFYILLNAIVRTQIGILSGFSDFKGIAKINTVIGIMALPLTLLAYFYSLYGALIGVLIIQVLNLVLNLYQIKKNLREFPPPSKSGYERKTIREILSFSFPVALQEALYSVLAWLSGLLLVKFSTYGEVGLNSAATYWSAVILFVPGILRNVVLSHMSASINDKERHNQVLYRILFFNLAVTTFLSLTVYFFSDFISSLYGENFTGLSNVLSIAVFTTIFSSLSNVYAQAYMSEGKNWLMLFFRLIRDIAILYIAFTLITKAAGENGALSLVTSALVANVLFLILMGGFYELRLKKRHY